jgi:hypothetical protein
MSERQRYIKIKSISQGSYYIDVPNTTLTLPELLDGTFPGDGYIVSIVEMTKDEYKALPEFQGF